MQVELTEKRIALGRLIRIQTDLAELSAIVSLSTSRIERVWQHEDMFLDQATDQQITEIESLLNQLKAKTNETFLG